MLTFDFLLLEEGCWRELRFQGDEPVVKAFDL